jgi:hypothetical protein
MVGGAEAVGRADGRGARAAIMLPPLVATPSTARQACGGPASGIGAASTRRHGRGDIDLATQANSGWGRRRGQGGVDVASGTSSVDVASGVVGVEVPRARLRRGSVEGAGIRDMAASSWPELGVGDVRRRGGPSSASSATGTGGVKVVLQLPHPGCDLIGTAVAGAPRGENRRRPGPRRRHGKCREGMDRWRGDDAMGMGKDHICILLWHTYNTL